MDAYVFVRAEYEFSNLMPFTCVPRERANLKTIGRILIGDTVIAYMSGEYMMLRSAYGEIGAIVRKLRENEAGHTQIHTQAHAFLWMQSNQNAFIA